MVNMDSSTLLPLINAFYGGSLSKAQTPAEKRHVAEDFSLMLRTMMFSTLSSTNLFGGTGNSASSSSVSPYSIGSNPSQSLLETWTGTQSSSLLNSLTSSGQDSLTGVLGSSWGLPSISSAANDQENNWGTLGNVFNSNMSSLFEKLLSNNLNSGGFIAPTDVLQAESFQPAAQAVKGDHINQFAVEIQVGGDGANANCGPASLVMALRSLGMCISGETSTTTDGEAVDMARHIMASDPNRDGVNTLGQRDEKEHSINTNFSDLLRGAQLSGGVTVFVPATAAGIQSALEKGAKVIASGSFEDKDPPPWTGDNGWDKNGPPGGATLHIVAITGFDKASRLFEIQDPARNSPIQVDAHTLDYFMSDNAGALAISHP
jgi:hypothetical protein